MRTLATIFDGLLRFFQRLVFTPFLLGWLAVWIFLGMAIGTLLATPVVFGVFDQEPGESAWQWVVFGPFMLAGAVFAIQDWLDRSGAATFFGDFGQDSHGSARFAGKRELKALEAADGLLIGRNPKTGRLLFYDGPAHLLTLAPTRAGKGVGTVIPNLLAAERSVLVIDPKGENARIAGVARERFGTVHVLDPFGVSGRPSAAYNPLDRLSADSPDLSEDAASLADALVVDPAHQTGDAHWNEEAKALIGGLIMFCVAHEDPACRNLGSVREYLTLPPDRMADLLKLMQDSEAADGLVARAANRFAGKADREAASVLSNAQRHTHFLDSPRMARVMARSDFHFAELRHRITSVFLVLPPNRLDAYSRWLRLLVSQALQDIARDAEVPLGPEIAAQAPQERLKASNPTLGPALFLLDEFAALGRLEAVERAMGLMAGYGLQLWPILQGEAASRKRSGGAFRCRTGRAQSQLRDLYGQRASTFVANAGVQQVFGVNDFETAKSLSQTMGQETVGYETRSFRPGDMPTTGTSIAGRDLLTPDEIMQLPQHLQLLRVQGQPTALVRKFRYYADREFDGLYVPQSA
ncbi:MAG: type IV secretory system conjugative DNA transfer family protein [Jannaschia sp.]